MGNTIIFIKPLKLRLAWIVCFWLALGCGRLCADCVPAPSGLVAWWRGENSAYDAVGDSTALILGCFGYSDGAVGAGFRANWENEGLKIPASPAIDVGRGAGFTFEGWYSSSDNSKPAWLLRWRSDYQVGVSIALSLPGLSRGIRVDLIEAQNIALSHAVVTTTNLLGDNVYQHLAVTYDRAGGLACVYLNGAEVARAVVGSFQPETGLDLLFAGQWQQQIGLRKVGLDELSLYNRALSALEIRSIYEAGSAGKCFNPAPPAILESPTNQTAYVLDSMTLAVRAEGTQPLSYEWRFNGEILSNASANSFRIPVFAASNAGDYSVVVSSPYGAVTSSVASVVLGVPQGCVQAPAGMVGWWRGESGFSDELGLNDGVEDYYYLAGWGYIGFAPYLGSHVPANRSLDVGLDEGFSVEGWICPDISRDGAGVSWEKSRAECGVSFSLVSSNGLQGLAAVLVAREDEGIPQTIATAPDLLAEDEYHHVALTYEKSSGAAAIYVNGQVVAEKKIGSMALRTTNDFYFQGVDELSLYDRALSLQEVQSICNARTLGKCVVPLAPVFRSQPTNQALLIRGMQLLLQAAVSGSSPMSYRWFKDGSPVTWADGLQGGGRPVLMMGSVSGSNSGNYVLVVSNAYGCATSSVAHVLVSEPVLISLAEETVWDRGAEGFLSVEAMGSEPFDFQWRKNGARLAGQTNSTLHITQVQVSDQGGYDVVVSSAYGCATSTVSRVFVNTAVADGFTVLSDSSVHALAEQLGTNLVCGGAFTSLRGEGRQMLARLGQDGTLLRPFDTQSNLDANFLVPCMAVQADGKIIAKRGSASYNPPEIASPLLRFDSDGAFDPQYLTLSDEAGIAGQVNALAWQPDGKLLVASYVVETTSQLILPRLCRLNTDGTLDRSFASIMSPRVVTLAVQPDGRILVGGFFTNICGESRSYLARLWPDGSLDRSFNPRIPVPVYCLALQSDGRILVGGVSYSLGNGDYSKGLARYLSDGSRDFSFEPELFLSGEPTSLVVQSDGKVVCSRAIWQEPWEVQRFERDGLRDQSIRPRLSGDFSALALQSDGRLLLGAEVWGELDSTRTNLVRLKIDESPARRALVRDGESLAWITSGHGQQAAWVKFQASANGSNWTDIGLGVYTNMAWRCPLTAVSSGTQVRALGAVSGGLFNGSCWFVQDRLRLNRAVPAPRIQIVSPGAGWTATNESVAASGVSSGIGGVSGVWYQLNGGAWELAEGTTRWTAFLSPVPGRNVLRAFAVDTNGVASATATVSFERVQKALLRVTADAGGTVLPNYDGRWLEIGKTYSMTATPGAGLMFAGWTGSLSNDAARLSFVMQSNMVLQAHFSPNPYLTLAGAYAGIFQATEGAVPESSASLSLAVTRSGAFSGTVQQAAKRYSISGHFGADGMATLSVSRGKAAPLAVTLRLGVDGLSGTLSDGVWSSQLTARGAAGSSFGQAGRFTMILSGLWQATNAPSGHGFGAVTLSQNGQISVAGTLADGTRFSQSVLLTRAGRWPLYLPLYQGGGLAVGWLAMTNGYLGETDWIKPGLAREKYFTNGFSLRVSVWGSLYVPPVANNGVLSFHQGSLLLKPAGAEEATIQNILLRNGSWMSFSSYGHGFMKFAPSSGLFAGSVFEPHSEKMVPVQGVVMQHWNAGCGCFFTPLASGGIVFGPTNEVEAVPPGWRPE
jgi:uncharacterized delta-60 repeat protein